MSNQLIPVGNSFDEQFEEILEQFNSAMFALPMQDAQGAEQAFYKAKMIYSNVAPSENDEENKYLKLIVYFIETTSKFLRASLFLSEERLNRSLEEFDACKKLYSEASTIFKQIPSSFGERDEYGLFEMLKFQFAYFQHLMSVMEIIVRKSIELKEGKYVNETEVFKEAAANLRNFPFHNHDMDDDHANMWVTGSMALLNRMADTYEKKAERLEERRKVIDFLKPIDKNVFIVHGHGEGVLRELKEMLEESFQIKPLILRDELDFGKTIIEKFEHYGRLCAFIFVIITPDDIAENKKKKVFQARPNVLFELGWFCGRFGREKVRIIRQKETSIPSDLNGIVTIDFSERIEEVYRRIQTELKSINLL